MSDAESREKNRLRSERWRRRHGIGPRRQASKPWLAEGVSRSTWYRRGNRIGSAQTENVIRLTICGHALDRADASLSRLSRELVACAGFHAVMASILREFPAR